MRAIITDLLDWVTLIIFLRTVEWEAPRYVYLPPPSIPISKGYHPFLSLAQTHIPLAHLKQSGDITICFITQKLLIWPRQLLYFTDSINRLVLAMEKYLLCARY
jgi:hypothetical protein